ncbi:MAG TPA: GTP 3',8-cyclase MoaA [Bacteroidota bacterium]|nr:GTP 3',8-cyclase MoaA [Bacteroidota bacterium]
MSTMVRPDGITELRDSFGRVVNNLRISVTDRCNFRCRYCMPEEGMQWMNKSELLTFEELARFVQLCTRLGISKIRLTGGEPLMRKELHLLVEKISRIEGIKDLGLTTNGYFLAEQAIPLFKAGLRRLNISLDSLDAAKFNSMTRRNYYGRVWEGIEAAEAIGFAPLKLNVVLIRGINDDEIPRFATLVRTKPFIVRFIEFMPIGSHDEWTIEKVVPTHEIVETMERSTGRKLTPVGKRGHQPADRYVFDDGVGEVGFISSVSEPFCDHCNRIRITADGKLRTCLFSLVETDLKALMRGGAGDDEICDAVVQAVRKKEEGHRINRPEFVRPARTMSQIGG